MKKIALLIGLALLAGRTQAAPTNSVAAGTNQTLMVTQVVVTNVVTQPVIWSGASARALWSQVAGITNAAGNPVLPTNGGFSAVTFRVKLNTNGVVSSVIGRIQ
jgi:hypothetical protein